MWPKEVLCPEKECGMKNMFDLKKSIETMTFLVLKLRLKNCGSNKNDKRFFCPKVTLNWGKASIGSNK